MTACVTCSPKPFLPTSMNLASLLASSRTPRLTKRSWITTSASWSNRRALSVSSSGSPGPAPTKDTDPVSCSAPMCRAKSVSKSRLRVLSLVPPLRRVGEKNSFQKLRRAKPSGSARTFERNELASLAKRPRSAGSMASTSAFICRARTGAEPSVPIATTTGSRSTTAGVIKSHASVRSKTLTMAPASRANNASSSLIASLSWAA